MHVAHAGVVGHAPGGAGGGSSRSTETGRAGCTGAGGGPVGTSGTTRTRRVPSAKSVVAASSGATVREGRSKVQRAVPDFSPARHSAVTTQAPVSLR